MLLPPRNFAGNLSCLKCCLDSVSIGRAVGLGLGNFDSVSCQDAYSSLLGQARSWWPKYSAGNVNVALFLLSGSAFPASTVLGARLF